MSSASVTLDGYSVGAATVQIPAWGAWWADVALPEAFVASVGQRVVLRVVDVELHGTVVTGGAVDERSAYRIVGGAGGWGRSQPAKSYRASPGVRVSKILQDLAAAAGETLGPVPGTTLGEHYARAEGPAYRTLNGLAPRAWYVDALGNTQFGARPTATYTGSGAIVRRDRAAGVVEIDTDELAQLVPGVQVDGQAPATDVEYSLSGSKLVARVFYAAVLSDRRLSAYAAIFDALDPFRKYRGTYEYRVVFQVGERLDLQVVRRSTGLDDLASVPVRPGMAGLRADVLPGSLVLVTFVDADPSRPCVISHSAPDDPGWMPLFLELGGPGALGVARMTDAVQAGPFSGAILSGSLRVKAAI
jgi:hypothetical protein